MSRYLRLLPFLMLVLSCNNSRTDVPASETDLDAARNFIRSALDGKWSEARRFMIQDSVNTQILDRYEERYQRIDREEQRGYREASIINYDPRKVNDSTIIFNYANSFIKQKDSLKVVKVNGSWLVDLKYSYFSNADSLRHAP
jgi:hypothetical protein